MTRMMMMMTTTTTLTTPVQPSLRIGMLMVVVVQLKVEEFCFDGSDDDNFDRDESSDDGAVVQTPAL